MASSCGEGGGEWNPMGSWGCMRGRVSKDAGATRRDGELAVAGRGSASGWR
jgi:hypothetical protein